MILSNIEKIERLEKYIINQYESALEGNKTYIENVKVGQTNYNKYLIRKREGEKYYDRYTKVLFIIKRI